MVVPTRATSIPMYPESNEIRDGITVSWMTAFQSGCARNADTG